MPTGADGVLTATWRPEAAAVSLEVLGSAWSSAVVEVRIERRVAGESVVPVRGADRVPAVGGYWVGTDHEQPLESSVTYQAIGYTAAGAQVLSAMVTVSTSGAPHGIWLKAPGKPNLTVRLGMVERGTRSSTTQGGVYNIAGGRGVAVAAASGRDGDTMTLRVRPRSTAELESALALLDEHRVLLIQPVAVIRPFRDAWWFVSSVEEALLTQADRADYWDITLNLTRVGVPAGAGQGVVGWSYAAVAGTYATYAALKAAKASYFDVARGA